MSSARPSIGDNETSFFQDVTRSVDQLCVQMSLNNVSVPRFSSYNDVFDFLTEFETATTASSDDQKLVLLAKAFPPGRHRAWYETDLAPLIKGNAPWSVVKSKLIARFSDTEDRDRHFVRLRELNFNPESGQKLLDFVEDILYSYKKAYPKNSDAETCVRYTKASIPAPLKPSLGMIPGYKDAIDEESFKKAIKQFDASRSGLSDGKKSDRIGATELANILKDMMSGIRKENEVTRNAIVSALRSNDRPQQNDNRRGYSPRRRDYQSPSRDNRRPSTNYHENRPASPHGLGYNNRNNDRPDPKSETREAQDQQNKPIQTSEHAFSTEKYFARFGKPPSACDQCNDWHWIRHCPLHLN